MLLDTLRVKLFASIAQRKLFAKAMPVFTYHHVSTPPRSSQMARLEQLGFTTGCLSDVVATKGNPERKVVITFDDGYDSVFRNALPVLAMHRFKATQFLVSGLIGKRNEWDIPHGANPERLMDEAQIREWLAEGHEIGSHTRTHPNLRKVSAAMARAEIFDSKKELEDRFGCEVTCFCFPHGTFNELLCDLVQEAGYKAATTVRFGINLPGTSPFALSRIIPLTPLDLLGKVRHRFTAAKETTGRAVTPVHAICQRGVPRDA